MPAIPPAGILDSSFNGNGVVTTTIGTNAQANATAIDNCNNIVAAGYAISSGATKFALARYTSSGSFDGTFGTGGTVLTSIGSGATINAIAFDFLMQNIVVVGSAIISGLPNFAICAIRVTVRLIVPLMVERR